MNKQEFNRRHFIKGIGAATILWQTSLLFSCQQSKSISPFAETLSNAQQQILHRVLNILFPKTNQSPDIVSINTEYQINYYLTDPLIDPDEQKYLIKGIGWLDQTSQKIYKKPFMSLNNTKQITIINKILKTSWGESWLSKLLTLIFESLLLDPIYHINTNQAGWQWLHHQAGQPRPMLDIAYPEILKRKKEQIIITGLDQL